MRHILRLVGQVRCVVYVFMSPPLVERVSPGYRGGSGSSAAPGRDAGCSMLTGPGVLSDDPPLQCPLHRCQQPARISPANASTLWILVDGHTSTIKIAPRSQPLTASI